ncbi:MAG: flagellar basal body rod protein FlgB [Hyphomicrobiales bacterium]|nr:flagellar basal body rod protein FlgB [Hyphomicrobiales bacterium]
MGPVQLFEFASRQAEWLASRQAVIAGNVAHADTPNYKAKDVVPFARVLGRTQLAMGATHASHLQGGASASPEVEVKRDRAWEISHSGNSVRLEQELIKTGEVNRGMSLNTSIVQTFHRMLLTSLRSQ